MSLESSERNAANSATKSNDDAANIKKLRKTMSYLFTEGGLKERNVSHDADDEVAVEDIISCGHFKGKYSEDDFDRAFAKDCHDIILKQEPHFQLFTRNGRKMVKYFKDGLQYKESAESIQLKDKASCEPTQESTAEEDFVNEEEQGKGEENEKIEHKNDSATGNKKKKKNKKNKPALDKSQTDTNMHQSKEQETEKNHLPNVPMEKETSVSEESETKTDKKSENKGKHQNNPTDRNTKSQPSKETKSKTQSGKSVSETKDPVITGTADEEEFTAASSKKSSKKPSESLGKDRKQTEKSPAKGGKQIKEQKVTESKENAEKQKTDNSSATEKLQKKETDVVNSTALSSDEEKTPASAEGPPSKKKKRKAEDKLKKIPKTFEYLFLKNGLKEKQIQVRDDGFVKVKSIIDVYDNQYEWTEQEIIDALDSSKDYIFKQDGTDGVLVKSSGEQKSKSEDKPAEIQEPQNDDSWKEGGKKRGQDDRKQRPTQDNAAGRATAPMTPDKLRSSLFWILGKDGATTHSIQFQPGNRVYVDEIIKKVSSLNQVLANEIKAAADADPRKEFVIEEINGQMTIRLQKNRAPRDRNTDFPGKSDFHLSKTMSFLLRHGADRLQLPIHSDGFIFVNDLLSCKDLRSYKEEDVKRIVEDNDKQRFLLAVDSQTGLLKVRANQGHTLSVPDLELQPITSAKDAPIVVHGTYSEYWKAIQKQGLSRMKRNHIHFAGGEPGDDGVISGMRQSCDVLIYLDLEKALNDGLKFYRSANNVILSPGDDRGCVEPKYFKSAVQRSPRMKLM